MYRFYIVLFIFPVAAYCKNVDIITEPELAKATFAGGCFWCMEPPFDKIRGVKTTIPGYSGGHKKNPTYDEVSSGTTGHYESLQVIYDPTKVSFEKLLQVFWHNVDPTNNKGQFCDEGEQYRSAIFFHNDEQKRLAELSKKALENSHRLKSSIKTTITPALKFYPANDLHQNYYKKNPWLYKFYRYICGRDSRLRELWSD